MSHDRIISNYQSVQLSQHQNLTFLPSLTRLDWPTPLSGLGQLQGLVPPAALLDVPTGPQTAPCSNQQMIVHVCFILQNTKV